MSELLNKTNEQESTQQIELLTYSKEAIECAKNLLDSSFKLDGIQRADVLITVYKILCANFN